MSDVRDESRRRAEDSTSSQPSDRDSRYSAFEGATEDFGIGPGASDPLIGADIGGVTVVRLIGQGGMGRVYEARQVKPSRPVAVKVIRPGVVSELHMRRFDHEAEILARLRHPGIAQIHTVGTYRSAAGNVPFFVMEYIPDARTLVDYADDHGLSTHDRLHLFRKVCDAVAHGHARGVVHRDLKPSNILVDSAGQPKVIDFGVAKTTDVDLALTTIRTDVGQLIGTLQYMSPEQFDGVPEQVDVRSDVYALGVVLYELLAGQPPYDVRRKAVVEAARVVKEEDPTPLPSLNRTLRRDVGVIAGKCLAKEPDGRYMTAGELGADVARYLAGERILANPPGFLDSVVRLSRRHKTVAVAVSLVVAALSVAVLGISLFAARAERQRKAATEFAAIADYKRHVSDLNRFWLLKERGEAVAATALLDDIQSRFPPDEVPIEVRMARTENDDAIAVLPGHSFAFSPDGALLAIRAAGNAQAQLVDPVTCEKLAVLDEPHGLIGDGGLRFSSDDTRVWFQPGVNSLIAKTWSSFWGGFFGDDRNRSCLDSFPDSSIDSNSWTIGSFVSPAGERALLHVGVGLTAREIQVETKRDCITITPWESWSTRLSRNRSGDTIVLIDDGGIIQVTHDLDNAVQKRAEGAGSNATGVIQDLPRMRRVLAVSDDGGFACCESSSGTVLVVSIHKELHGKRCMLARDDDEVVTSAGFGLGGRILITVSFDGTMRGWDCFTGDLLWSVETRLVGCPPLSISPDGQHVAVFSAGVVLILNANDGTMLATLSDTGRRLTSFAFSPTEAVVALGDRQGDVTIHQLPKGEVICRKENHGVAVSAMAFSSDGMTLASRDINDGLVVVGLRDGRVHRFDNYSGIGISFDPTATRVLLGVEQSRIGIGDVQNGTSSDIPWESNRECREYWFTSSGKTIVAVNEDYEVFASLSGLQPRKLFSPLFGVVKKPLSMFDVDLRSLTDGEVTTDQALSRAVIRRKQGLMQLWNLADLRLTQIVDAMPACEFSPDGTRLLGFGTWDGEPNTDRNFLLDESEAHNSVRNRWAAIASRFSLPPDSEAEYKEWTLCVLWDAQTGRELAAFGVQGVTSTPAFSPDSEILFINGHVRSLRTGKPVAHYGSRAGNANFSPDGTLIVLSGTAGIELLKRTEGDRFNRVKGFGVRRAEGSSPFFSPDGTYLGFHDEKAIHVWEKSGDGREYPVYMHKATLRGRDTICNATFNPDATRIAAQVGREYIALWGLDAPHSCCGLQGEVTLCNDEPTIVRVKKFKNELRGTPWGLRQSPIEMVRHSVHQLTERGFEASVAPPDAVTTLRNHTPVLFSPRAETFTVLENAAGNSIGNLSEGYATVTKSPFKVRVYDNETRTLVAETSLNAVSPTGTYGVTTSPAAIIELATGQTSNLPELASIASGAGTSVSYSWSADERFLAFAIQRSARDGELMIFGQSNGRWQGPVLRKHCPLGVEIGLPRGPSSECWFSFAKRGGKVFFADGSHEGVFPSVTRLANEKMAVGAPPVGTYRALSTDLARAVTTRDGKVIVWDTALHQEIGAFLNECDVALDGVRVGCEFDSSGNRAIIWFNQGAWIWAADRPQEGTFLPNCGGIRAAVFNPDATRLAIMRDGRTLDGGELAILDASRGDVLGAWSEASKRTPAFVNGGKQILTYGRNAKLWGLSQREIALLSHSTQHRAGAFKTEIDSWLALGREQAVSDIKAATAEMSVEDRRVARGAFLSRAVERDRSRQRLRLDVMRPRLKLAVEDLYREVDRVTAGVDENSPEYDVARKRAVAKRLGAMQGTMSEDEFAEVLRMMNE